MRLISIKSGFLFDQGSHASSMNNANSSLSKPSPIEDKSWPSSFLSMKPSASSSNSYSDAISSACVYYSKAVFVNSEVNSRIVK